jgi:AcrR family transcriptional regulator
MRPVAQDRSSRQLGRPRDLTIDSRVLKATRELLIEKGFDGTNVHSIAERSGEHASAIYRRWPSRVEIIEEAVFPGLSSVRVRPTGDLRRDLGRFVRAYLAAFGAPEARAAMPGLLASYQSAGRSGAPEVWLPVSARPQFIDILVAAPEGEVDPDLEPDDVFDLLLGAILARTLVPTVAQRNRPVERLVDSVLRLLHPASARAATSP